MPCLIYLDKNLEETFTTDISSDKPRKVQYYEFLEKNCVILNPFTNNIDGLIPVIIVASIRTDYLNGVVTDVTDRFYDTTLMFKTAPLNLNEAVLLSAKYKMEETFNMSRSRLDKFILNTSLLITGAFKVNNAIYVYVNVVVSHKLTEGEDYILRDGFKFTCISNLSIRNDLERILASELVIVKENVNE